MDDKYSKIMRRFYYIYGSLQKKHGLRMNTSSSMCGTATIEIWEQKGRKEKRCVCRVVETDITECYERAIRVLKMYDWDKGNVEYDSKKAG